MIKSYPKAISLNNGTKEGKIHKNESATRDIIWKDQVI